MKIPNERVALAALPTNTLASGAGRSFAAVKNNLDAVALNPQPLPPKIAGGVAAALKDMDFGSHNPGGPGGLPGGVNLPGGNGALGNGGIPGAGGVGGLGNGGIPGGLGGRGGLGGFDGLEGAGGLGGLGGLGSRNGPPGGFKMPGSDRMDGGPTGLDGGGAFLKGTWDFGSNGPQVGGLEGGATVHGDWMPGRGVGPGFKDGQFGGAEGDATGGGVKTPGSVTGGSGNSGTGDKAGGPEGLDWSRGTSVAGEFKSSLPPAEPKKDTNDLGPSTNEPAQTNEPDQQPKEEDTAVAKNDDPKGGGEAGKPDPNAMPADDASGSGGNPRANPNVMPADDSAGGNIGPRSITARSSTSLSAASSHASVAFRASLAATPNPEGSGGGTPRSLTANIASSLGSLFMPDPDGTGGGTPRSAVANVGALASVATIARRG